MGAYTDLASQRKPPEGEGAPPESHVPGSFPRRWLRHNLGGSALEYHFDFHRQPTSTPYLRCATVCTTRSYKSTSDCQTYRTPHNVKGVKCQTITIQKMLSTRGSIAAMFSTTACLAGKMTSFGNWSGGGSGTQCSRQGIPCRLDPFDNSEACYQCYWEQDWLSDLSGRDDCLLHGKTASCMSNTVRNKRKSLLRSHHLRGRRGPLKQAAAILLRCQLVCGNVNRRMKPRQTAAIFNNSHGRPVAALSSVWKLREKQHVGDYCHHTRTIQQWQKNQVKPPQKQNHWYTK